MKEIRFRNPLFKDGLNFTVRLGGKWKALSVGGRADIARCPTGEKMGSAIIDRIYCCRINNIPKEVYDNEHDESCRDKLGLRSELERVYEDKNIDINGDSVVTCIGFYFIPDLPNNTKLNSDSNHTAKEVGSVSGQAIKIP